MAKKKKKTPTRLAVTPQMLKASENKPGSTMTFREAADQARDFYRAIQVRRLGGAK